MKKYFYPEFIDKLPLAVKKIFSLFGEENIRLVGGCVRDLIIKKNVNDYDFACVFLPEKIVEILNFHNIKNIATGLKYGTITAVIDEQNFQITTLRKDKNQRGRDCDVDFTNDYMIDASRRDFTINALYMDKKGYVYDYFNGVDDLKYKVVRFINDSNERIKEDFLRIMRFFRFSCFYADKFDAENLSSAIFYQNFLKKISQERIREEFYKIIKCQNHDKVTEVLSIFQKYDFDLILWNLKINHEAYKKLLKYYHQIDQNKFFELTIAAIFFTKKFIDNENNLRILADNLKLSNIEKKLINQNFKLLKHYSKDPLSKNDINLLLVQYKKSFVIDFLILGQIKNIWLIADDDFSNLLNYSQNKIIPIFPIQINDLRTLDCPNNFLSDIINKTKEIWAKNDFNIDKENLILMASKLIKEKIEKNCNI